MIIIGQLVTAFDLQLSRQLQQLSKSPSVNAPHNIQVNLIAQNYVENPVYYPSQLREQPKFQASLKRQVPLGRLATTDDLVGVYHFLAADESSYVSGQSINVDGGWTCGPSKKLLEKVIGSGSVS